MEEAQFAGKWVVCMTSRESSESTEWLNYIRFLLEKSSKGAKEASPPIHESFRVWIVCSSLSSYLSLAPLSVPSNCVAVGELRTVRTENTSLVGVKLDHCTDLSTDGAPP